MPISAVPRFLAAAPSLETLLQGPQRAGAIAGILFVVVLYLIIFIASIVILIRAFRTSVVWGLVVFFVPFGILVFVGKHWQETKRPFLVQLVCAIALGALVAFGMMTGALQRQQQQQQAAVAANAKPTPHEVRDLAENETPEPTVPTDPNAAQRAAYVKHAKELNTLYQQLNAERPKLKPGSPAVAAFNAKAARYQQGLQSLAEEKTRLDALDHAGNLNTDAATALTTLQTSAQTGDYEVFAATLKKSLSEYRQTPAFPQIVAFARTALQQATPDKVLAGLQTKASASARADFDKTTKQVQGIVNQVPQIVPKPPDGADVFHYSYHPGANKPDYNAENLVSTRELWKGQYVYMDEAPGVFYRSGDCEFNPQTKFFYTSRNVPKKRLSDMEYKELTRLYPLLGPQEKAVASVPPPTRDAERVSGDLAALKAQLDGYAMK